MAERRLETGNESSILCNGTYPPKETDYSRIEAGSSVFSRVVRHHRLPYSRNWMPGSSQTLRIGDRAPEFTLAAANRSGVYSLPHVLARGPVILEFLRGTW